MSGRNSECEICGAPLMGLTLARHAAHASRQAFGKDGDASARARRDPQLLRHAQRLEWSRTASGTMRGGAQ